MTTSLFLTLMSANLALTLKMVNWTLYTSTRTWNEAKMTCEETGGILASPLSHVEKQAFVYLMEHAPWAGNIGSASFVGLFTLDGNSSSLVWINCEATPNNVYVAIVTNYFNAFCGAVITSFQSLSPDVCFGSARTYICEHSASYCDFLNYPSALPNITSSASKVLDESECRDWCQSENETCWAFSYSQSANVQPAFPYGVCNLYNPGHPMYFENGSNLVNSTSDYTSVKRCFRGSINSQPPLVSMHGAYEPAAQTCWNSSTERASVYTFLSSPTSWAQAVRQCQARKQRLAVIDTDAKFITIKTLLEEKRDEYYWVGYREVAGSKVPSWSTGHNVTNFIPEDPNESTPACGSIHMVSGAYQLHSCGISLPFVCEHVKGPCVHAITLDARGTQYTDAGAIEINECRSTCESLRSAGSGCTAFSYYYGTATSGQKCYHHKMKTWTDNFAGNFPITPEASWILARWTCIVVVRSSVKLPVLSSTSLLNNSMTQTPSRGYLLSSSTQVTDTITTMRPSKDTTSMITTADIPRTGSWSSGTGLTGSVDATSDSISTTMSNSKTTTGPTTESTKFPTAQAQTSVATTEQSTISNTGQPTISNAEQSTISNTEQPTTSNTEQPTISNTEQPTISNTEQPTISNTEQPTISNTEQPTTSNTEQPTISNTEQPTISNTEQPTSSNTEQPTISNTEQPTTSNTEQPTTSNTEQPTISNTEQPTISNTEQPTISNTEQPTISNTEQPTISNTEQPTISNTEQPTTSNTEQPTISNTEQPTISNTEQPTTSNTEQPTTTDTSSNKTAFRHRSRGLCRCACSAAALNVSVSEAQAEVEEIVKELAIVKKTISATKRKKESAEDHRPSATWMGLVASAFILVIFVFIVSMDAYNIIMGQVGG